MSVLRTSTSFTAVAITALALTLASVPVIAVEEASDPTGSIVAGEILLPEGSSPLADSTILITVEDTRRADGQSGVLASLAMAGSGAESPVPFALSVVPAVLEASEVDSPLDITLNVRVESPDGSLLYTVDSAMGAVTPTGPITDLEIPVVAAEGD